MGFEQNLSSLLPSVSILKGSDSYEILVEIETGVFMRKFPKRALHHVLEWPDRHGDEMVENWKPVCRQETLDLIE